MPGDLERVRETAAALKRARETEAEAFEAFKAAISSAHAAGETTRAIAKAAGISHARVFQLLQQ